MAGSQSLEDGDCRRALPDYEEATRHAPLYAQLRPALLACLTQLERWDEAEEQAQWLLQRRPGFPTMRLAIARYYAARGRTDDALANLDAALATWSAAEPDYRPAIEARVLRDSVIAG